MRENILFLFILVSATSALQMNIFDSFFSKKDKNSSENNVKSNSLEKSTSSPSTTSTNRQSSSNLSPMGKFPDRALAVKNRYASPVAGDANEIKLVRPLLADTQLETRKLQVVYRACTDGWSGKMFHKNVNGKGAALVLAKLGNTYYGGYNPKGWVGMGENRNSIAAFIFVLSGSEVIKLCKLGGQDLAVTYDQGAEGIYFGQNSLVIPLDGTKKAKSKLGVHYETLPDGSQSLFGKNAATDVELSECIVIAGVYSKEEIIPFTEGL